MSDGVWEMQYVLEKRIAELEAENQRLKAEREWITRKLKLSVDAPMTEIQGQLHVVCGGNDQLNTLAPIWDKQQAELKAELQAANLAHEQYREWAAGQMEALQAQLRDHRCYQE